MGWFAWIILGGVAGALAKWIMPGSAPGGFIITIIIATANEGEDQHKDCKP